MTMEKNFEITKPMTNELRTALNDLESVQIPEEWIEQFASINIREVYFTNNRFQDLGAYGNILITIGDGSKYVDLSAPKENCFQTIYNCLHKS